MNWPMIPAPDARGAWSSDVDCHLPGTVHMQPDTTTMVQMADRVEADALAAFAASASTEAAAACGILLRVHQGVVGCFTANADVLALNRVVGFTGPATDGDIQGWIQAARAATVPRFMVQVPPLPGSALESAAASAGGHVHNRWVRLVRRLDEPVGDQPACAYRVEQIERGDPAASAAYAAVLAESFGLPAVVQPWVAGSIGRPGWRHYAARAGDTIVATAAMYVCGAHAWFGFASTKPEARGRGAQTALIARRLADAGAAGVEWGVTETAEDTPERRAPSFHNMRRMGFQEICRRPNYLFDLRTGSSKGEDRGAATNI